IEPEPNQSTLALCGKGGEDKRKEQRMVQRFLNLDAMPQPDDTADALAAAITGLAFDGAIK
ncbi:MAG: crossover junction endodeoxyribonuclease RuvC, partial [Synergistaceae bacterium]|nr:crossover junction endodeoxyribonuclease RuvC [Synergistaceae bacterium]